eukprot:TRINITY_DN12947_c0_g1_i2.p1 TRINITY_DN12947_c0_g1~~TRINITY_DN12947_c0_g1_i2.p1  ORF type:complete len:276 (-),score=38.92 TRINITY_DN12947_c0_g1_i2:45-872(-)
MNNLKLDLESYEDVDYAPQLCTNCDYPMNSSPFDETVGEFSETSKITNDFSRTSDLMEDISPRQPALPSSLEYLTEWRLSNSEKRSSLERLSLESHGVAVPRLSLTQGEKQDEQSKVNPFEVSPQYRSMADKSTVAEMIPEKTSQPALILTSILRGCNCKKTNCLKFYCECFASGKVCGPDCNCLGCRNVEGNQTERQEAVVRIMRKHPLSIIRNTKNSEIEIGCNCKKSSCKRNYCFCFRKGLKCSDKCKCTGCCNKEAVKSASNKIFILKCCA